VSALCSGVIRVEEIDLVCRSLVHLFQANGTAVHLLKWAIRAEVQTTSDASLQNVLREDNRMATQFLRYYASMLGNDYLVAVLKPAIRKVISSHDCYEVNPGKLGPKDKVEKNIKKLKKLCQAILDSVFSPKNVCPTPIQLVAFYLHQEVNNRKGDGTDKYGLSCVSTFFFLRFFCPALISPKDYHIVKKTPTKEAQTGLLLAAKIVQALANGQPFTQPHLLPLNSFIEANQEKMKNFLDNLVSKSAVSFQDHPASSTVIPVEEIETEQGPHLQRIKDYCARNRKKFSYESATQQN